MNTLQGPDRYAATAAAVALALLVLMVALLAGAPLYTEDLWWHLKDGEMFAAEGPWPASDWMLHTASDEAPIQHEWLFSVSVFALDRLLGFYGLRFVHFALAALIVWLVYSICRRAGEWPVAACFATCLFIVLAWARLFQFRPDLVSITATLVGYRLLLESAGPPSWLRVALYTILIGIWVNFHSLFLVSLNLLFAALVALALAGVLDLLLCSAAEGRAARAAHRRQLAKRLATALVLGLLVAALNPRGFEQHLTFLTFTDDAALWQIADEWSHFYPFDFDANHDIVALPMWLGVNATLLGFLIVSAAAFIRLLRLRTARALDDFDAVRFGLGLAGIVATLISIRFMWLCIFPLLYMLHAAAWMRAGWPRSAIAAAWTMALASVLMAMWFSVGYGFAIVAARFAASPAEYFTMPIRTHKFHLEGVQFLAESRLEGNLFNSYAMGGFLEYWLAPRLRTFIDGRTVNYDKDVYLDYSAVTEMFARQAGESFPDILDRRNVDIFFGIGFPGWWHPVFTTAHLHRVPGWLLVSRSFRHAIYLRDNARNRDNLDRVAAYYQALGIPFDRERGLDPGAVIRARPDWAIQRSLLPSDYAEIVALARSGDPDARLRARNALALVYLLGGAIDEQIALDEQTARELAHDRRARQRLVYGLLRNDAVDQAQSVVEELLAIDPRDRWSVDLARLVNDYRSLGPSTGEESAQRTLQVLRNRLLWKTMPTTANETWAVEHAMPTEALALPDRLPVGIR